MNKREHIEAEQKRLLWDARRRNDPVLVRAGDELCRLLKRPECAAILKDLGVNGWSRGGCIVLAKALKTVFGKDAQIISLVELHESGDLQHHAAVEFKGMAWDENGACDMRTWLKWWHLELEKGWPAWSAENVMAQPFDFDRCEMLDDPEASSRLAGLFATLAPEAERRPSRPLNARRARENRP